MEHPHDSGLLGLYGVSGEHDFTFAELVTDTAVTARSVNRTIDLSCTFLPQRNFWKFHGSCRASVPNALATIAMSRMSILPSGYTSPMSMTSKVLVLKATEKEYLAVP